MTPSRDIERLIAIMAALRDPATGCPWDVEQTFRTIAPYTVEEAYEVVDAIERDDAVDLCDELGDLLLQVVFHARMAEEAGLFSFGDVVEAITTKMIRRHPHVFGPDRVAGAKLAKGQWEAIKELEKAEKRRRKVERATSSGPDDDAKAAGNPQPSDLDAVPRALPAMLEATKLQARAARHGFDWPDTGPVIDKIAEEARELVEARQSGEPDAVAAEWGDLAFVMINLARHLSVDPEMAIRGASSKFRRRFRAIEDGLARDGVPLGQATLEEMDAHWDAARRADKA